MTDTPTNSRIVECVLSVFPQTTKILLFGSRASDRAGPESDHDLLVVTQTELAPARRGAKVRLALRGLDGSFDVLVVTPDEFARLVQWKSTVVYRAEQVGRVLHEAA